MFKICSRKATSDEVLRSGGEKIDITVANDGHSTIKGWQLPMGGGTSSFAYVKGALGGGSRRQTRCVKRRRSAI